MSETAKFDESGMQIRSGMSVLIVDDDPGIRSSLKRIVSLDKYVVHLACDVDEAMSAISRNSYFAILLDLNLPGANQGDLISRIRAVAVNSAIIIITGNAGLESAIAAIRSGVDDYLVKPIEPVALRIRLNRLAEIYSMRRELAESESRFRAMVDHLPAGAAYVEGDRVFFNLAMQRITGFSSDEIKTIDEWFRRLCPNEASHWRAEYEAVRSGSFARTCVIPIETKDRGKRFLELAGYRYDNHEVWLVTDITDHRAAQHRLVQNERLAAIGEMVTGLAHESQNALQRAGGCLDLLELDLAKDSEQLDLTNRIRRALTDLRRLYEEVRTYAAPINVEFEPVNLVILCETVLEELKMIEPFGKLKLNIKCNGNGQIQADSHRLKQVFRNLFENAAQASSPDTTIEVEIDSTAISTSPVVEVRVSDHGSGMDATTAERLFEPFYTTKQKGTGLGLAITRRIIEAHGGKIFVWKTGSGGTTLKVILPVTRKHM